METKSNDSNCNTGNTAYCNYTLNKAKIREMSQLQSYTLVQDFKGPIYIGKGRNNSINFARIQKVQSRIGKYVFDKGLKYQYRIQKEVPDIKFWNQRYYYYSKFDDGVQMDFESKFIYHFSLHYRLVFCYSRRFSIFY